MTFVEILIDAIYEYVDRYIILDDTYLDETEESYESDETASVSDETYISDLSSDEDTDVSSDEDMTCTYTILT